MTPCHRFQIREVYVIPGDLYQGVMCAKVQLHVIKREKYNIKNKRCKLSDK